MKKNLDDLSDEELMGEYQNGEYKAFELLYQRNSGRVYGYLKKKVPAPIAQDLMQESFLKLHNYRQQYNSQYPFLPWLFTISRNTLFDYLRSAETQTITKSTSTLQLLDLPVQPEVEIGAISSLLVDLPADQKKAIELRYQTEWSFEQIAKEMRTSQANVRQLVSRGLRKLKTSFAGNGGKHE